MPVGLLAPRSSEFEPARRWQSRPRRRPAPDQSEVLEVVGDVEGKTAVIVEDMISTGDTLVKCAAKLTERGARKIYACAVHPVFAEGAMDMIEDSSIEGVWITDTLPLPRQSAGEKVHDIDGCSPAC
jgi:ribose-phosphate pyrophosphokinase